MKISIFTFHGFNKNKKTENLMKDKYQYSFFECYLEAWRGKEEKKREQPNDYQWGAFHFNVCFVQREGKKQDSLGERKQKEKSACFHNGKNFCKKKEQRVGMKWRRRRRKKNKQWNIPVMTLSLQARQALSCFAAFFTLSPFAFRNRFTQAQLQNFSYTQQKLTTIFKSSSKQ